MSDRPRTDGRTRTEWPGRSVRESRFKDVDRPLSVGLVRPSVASLRRFAAVKAPFGHENERAEENDRLPPTATTTDPRTAEESGEEEEATNRGKEQRDQFAANN